MTLFEPRGSPAVDVAIFTKLLASPSPLTRMQAFHRAQLPPTGVSHALSVRLTPPQDAASVQVQGVVVSHLITARETVLQVWEVRELESDGQASGP